MEFDGIAESDGEYLLWTGIEKRVIPGIHAV
jgi:hypothetical protein